jgi:hypothetical protein
MVDLQNPTSQFHTYQPPDVAPHPQGVTGTWALLKKVGLSDSQIESGRLRMEALDVSGSMNRVREYARQNPGKLLAGLAALVIGAGLLGTMTSRRRSPDRERE